MIPFEDDHNGILSEIEQLGEKIDFLIGVCDSRTWLSMCDFLSIGRYKKNIFKKIRSGKELTMKANYHTHTTRCQHAFGEDKEYVEEAIQAGLRILGFSDHCPWIYKSDYVSNIRMTPQETDGYFSSLEKLRREYEKDIDIFIGFESEYLPELMEEQDAFLKDYPVDYMILGQHFLDSESDFNYSGRMADDEDRLIRYVDLCIEGAKSGRYLYLAHPDLIYYTGSDKIYQREMKRLCEAMKQMNIPLEYNLLGLAIHRNYPEERFWQIVRNTGNSVIFGVDAHRPEQFADRQTLELAKKQCEGMNVVEQLTLDRCKTE